MNAKAAGWPLIVRVGDLVGKDQLRGRVAVDPYVVSVPEAAQLLGISKNLAYDLARRGELPGAFKLGRRWRVSLVRLRAGVHGPEDCAPENAR